MAVVMGASVFAITHDSFSAVTLALVPLLLGLLGILVGTAYGLTGAVFLTAVAFVLMPSNVKVYAANGITVMSSAFHDQLVADERASPAAKSP
jgi:uncharacterized membrane protein